MIKTIRVNASREYDVIIGGGLLDEAGSYFKKYKYGNRAVIVTDDIVGAQYSSRLRETLIGAGQEIIIFEIPHGESSKNAKNYMELLELMANRGLTRSDTVVALGGGVVGDLAGFAAASFMRGVRFVQIPTTLLAAVDSSVGGKTAINLSAGKNLAGAFYQPSLVLCDVTLLETLPNKVLADGCAEVIKYGVMADSELFELLKTPIQENLETVIARCVEIKRDVVQADEFETGQRKLLNLGHTIGHAIERLSKYETTHGAAVAAGMAIITRAAERSGLCADGCYDELIQMLIRFKLPYTTEYSAAELYAAAESDKKRTGGTITVVIPERIGKCVLREMDMPEFKAFIELGVF